MKASPHLSLHNLVCQRGERVLTPPLNINLSPGDGLCLSGENGAGKTTLIRTVAGLLAPVEGEVRWRGRPLRKVWQDYTSSMGYMSHKTGAKDQITLINSIHYHQILSEKPNNDRAQQALAVMGLSEQQYHRVDALSSGQRKRLAFAKLLSVPKALWLLDEPLASLDNHGQALIIDSIKRHLQAGGQAIIASHHRLKGIEELTTLELG